MRLSPSQIAEVVIAQSRQTSPQKVVEALGTVLVKRGQLRQFPLIRAAVRSQLERLGLVTIETARPLGSDDERQLTELLAKMQPPRTTRFTVNEGLGDGYRIYTEKGVVEVSTTNTLRALAHQLVV